MRIAFCSSEVFPFEKTGGLADVCGALPIALEDIGEELIIFLPKYGSIDYEGREVKQISDGVSKTSLGKNIDVYLIEADQYFDREGLYGTEAGDYDDNLERFQFFCSRILTFLKEQKLSVDIIHCHDWQTSLIPVYLKELYSDDPFYQQTKSVLTIHNLAFQGVFPKEQYSIIGLSDSLFFPEGFEFYGQINLLKTGIIYCDEVMTVSPQYAKEIQTQEFGCALDEVLHSREEQMYGIINGVDYNFWSPETDKSIVNYGIKNMDEIKGLNKKALQKNVGLNVDENITVCGFVGRLSHQKGVDLICESLDDLLDGDIQIVIQGVGDPQYYEALQKISDRHPGRLALRFEFDEELAHQIYAGSDLFLMPSLYEPCGLSQLISMRYGSIPVVFKTGGLADTVESFNTDAGTGNGFIFGDYTKDAFMWIMNHAVSVVNNKDHLKKLRLNAFSADFSWAASARKYQKVYQCLLSD